MNIGFIGVGGIAGNYLKSLQILERGAAAFCDLNLERAQQMAEAHGGRAYGSHTEMLTAESLDAVFICIPPSAHETQVADAAQAGAAVFVAKPVALHLETALRTRGVIAQAGVINQAGYMARYSDITEKARELIGERRIGLGIGRFMCRMGAGHPWWGKGAISGGQMLEQSTHVFDWLRYFIGEVEEVHAFGHRGNGGDIADFEDSTVANLRFKNGAAGNIASTACASVPDGFASEIMGRDWYLKATHDFKLTGQIEGESIDFTGIEAGYFRQVEQFLRAVEQGDQSLVRSSYEDAVRTLAVTLAANASLRSGRPEKVAEV
jgi:predicted dehydrogenase